MKKTTKIISMILAVVMVFSVLPVFASANAINKDVTTIEKFISNGNLANVVEYLVKNINAKKGDLTGTVLRLVYLFIDADDLTAELNKIQGGDVTKFSDAEAATVLLNWLDKNLPEWTKDITSQSWYGPVSNLVKLLGITLDLKSVDGVLKTVASLADVANNKVFGRYVFDLGILNELNENAIKNTKRSKGDLNVIYDVLQFAQDNIGIIKKAVSGNLSLGIVSNYVDLGDIEGAIKQLPDLIKSFLYKLIDSEAKAGEFKKDATKGDWGNSAYKDYTADQLLGAALIKAIKGTDDVVSKAEADKATSLSFYDILADYAPDLYSRFAIDWLNENLQGLIEKISLTDEIKNRFNQSIPAFTKDTFKEIFDNAKKDGFLSQINNLVVRIAELVLTPAANKELALVKGGNDKLNDNLLKIARYVLPAMANKTVSDKVGYDFTPFTKDAVAKMQLGDMVVAILKPFMEGWFSGSPAFSKEAVASVKNVRQLGAYVLYLTATNKDWDWVKDIDYDFTAIGQKILSGKTVKDLDDATAKDVIKSLAAGLGIGALQHNKDKIHFNVAIDASDWEKAAVQISNWALGFIKGMPAVVIAADLMNADDYGPFYKINVLLNELIDFSFLNDVNTENFKLDVETLLDDAVMGNLFDCDLAGVLHVFEKNTKEGNILNTPVIPSVIGALDRIITALFEHTHESAKTSDGKEYDKQSGYWVPGPAYKLGDVDNDGKITASDARLALRRAVNLETFEEGTREFLACDVTKDNKVAADDARVILRAAVGLETIA